MSKAKGAPQPSLFDLPAEPVEVDPSGYWNEVSQAVFLSWPEEAQLRYCARRDRHSETTYEDAADKQFFRERAEWYEREAANKVYNAPIPF